MLPFFVEGVFLHEMAIAEGILDIALQETAKSGGKKVVEVGLLLGELSGVETEALCFCWESLIKNTAADGARLKIKRIPLTGRCKICNTEQAIEKYNFVCGCGGILEVTGGRELRVEYLEVD